MEESMFVEILGWEKFNPRKDVKAPSWFRLSHSLFEDPDFYDMSHSEILVWIYLLCLASKKNRSVIEVNSTHRERVGRIKSKDFNSAISKLKQKNCIRIHDTSTLRERDASDPYTNATNERTNITNETNAPTPLDPVEEAAKYYAAQFMKKEKTKAPPPIREVDRQVLERLFELEDPKISNEGMKRLISTFVWMEEPYFDKRGRSLELLEANFSKVWARAAA
jgi:hypothetical protein